jgi:hypothetical protein
MDARNNIATDLFYKIRSRFNGLKLGAETGQITINPEEARFFDFDYMEGENPIGHVSISLAEPNSMKIYFSHGITENMDSSQKNNWYSFLRELRQFAKRRLLAFDTRDIAKDNLDKRDYAFLSQNAQPKKPDANTIQQPVGESVMNESTMYGTKTMSYQKLMDTRLIIKHNQTVMDDTQPGARTRNIGALFVENQDGERFKYPFIHLAGARAMQRHVANGGVPYDDVGKSIIGMSEEIAQLKSFGNYVVRNDLMNSENNSIVERSSSYLNNLRETIQKLSKQSHYEAYKESFQAQGPMEVPQEVVEEFTEKFTVRNFKEDIKSVFPVLYRLMQEENTLGYDDIVALTATEESTNEDIEVDDIEETLDPFEQFESWVMGLGEESAITSQDNEERAQAISDLQELVGQHFPAGVDGTNAIESLKGIIEDPALFQEIKASSKQDADMCVRPIVKAWLEQNAPEAIDQLDFGDMVEEPVEGTEESVDINEQEGFQRGEVVKVLGKYGKAYGGVALYIRPLDDDPDKHYITDENDVDQVVPVDALQPLKRGDQLNVDGYGEVTYIRQVQNSKPFSIYVTTQGGSDEMVKFRQVIPEDVTEADHDRHSAKKSDIPAAFRKAKGDDDWKLSQQDLEKEKERNISSKEWLKKQNNESLNVQELAEFITSFYDKDSGTFPKGPEGVCTMVGKKFGEQAEHVARKFVERMAPQQSTEKNPELQELARIRELSGM